MTDRPVRASIQFVIPCKGRLPHLQESLPVLLQFIQHQPGLGCTVVDWACPQHTGDWVQTNHPNARVVRSSPNAPFNLARARNLGALATPAEWLAFVDADVVLMAGALDAICARLVPGCYLRSDSALNELAGFLVCRTSDFVAAGGYDETIQGWGGEDRDLAWRLQRMGLRANSVPANALQAALHDDALRTQFYVQKDRFTSLRINSLYLQIKTDLARQTGVVQIPASERTALYQEVQRIVLGSGTDPAQLEVQMPLSTEIALPDGWQLQRRWHYTLAPNQPSP